MSHVDKQSVADYLRQNPDFFDQYPELLADIELSHSCGQATSLIERQTQVMRRKLQDYASKISEVLSSARRNDVQFEKTKQLIIELAAATSLNAVTEALKQGFINEFHADEIHLALFSKISSTDNHPNLSDAQGKAQIIALAEKNWAYCQPFKSAELRRLFQHTSDLKSCAIAPLYIGDTALGVLIIASNTEDHYNQQLDTLFLNHVAAVAGRCLGRLA